MSLHAYTRMLHSRHIAANYLQGNGLEVNRGTLPCASTRSKHTILGFQDNQALIVEVRVGVMAIRFGTSGWRAVIAEDFTFAGVRTVTRAICEQLRAGGAQPGSSIIIGYDTRFLGERFAAESAKAVVNQGFHALLCDRPTPTPTISHAIRSQRAVGGINFTASHNPPEYNGIKFSTADGAPALPEITKQIEQSILRIQDGGRNVVHISRSFPS